MAGGIDRGSSRSRRRNSRYAMEGGKTHLYGTPREERGSIPADPAAGTSRFWHSDFKRKIGGRGKGRHDPHEKRNDIHDALPLISIGFSGFPDAAPNAGATQLVFVAGDHESQNIYLLDRNHSFGIAVARSSLCN